MLPYVAFPPGRKKLRCRTDLEYGMSVQMSASERLRLYRMAAELTALAMDADDPARQRALLGQARALTAKADAEAAGMYTCSADKPQS